MNLQNIKYDIIENKIFKKQCTSISHLYNDKYKLKFSDNSSVIMFTAQFELMSLLSDTLLLKRFHYNQYFKNVISKLMSFQTEIIF